MAEFLIIVKDTACRAAKFVVRKSKELAVALKYKTNELGLVSKRRDLINTLGMKVYELHQQGVEFPQDLVELTNSITAIDENITFLKSEHAAKKAEAARQRADEKAARAAEKAASGTGMQSDNDSASSVELSEAPVDSEVQIDTDTVREADHSDMPTLNL